MQIPELVERICRYLDPASLGRVAATCRAFATARWRRIDLMAGRLPGQRGLTLSPAQLRNILGQAAVAGARNGTKNLVLTWPQAILLELIISCVFR